MKTHARLAKALDLAMKASREQVVRGGDLPPAMRTFLIRQGCLLEIMRGWYFLIPPDAPRGETALWHANFWSFLGLYLEDRGPYCLSPEISLDLLSGETATPVQVTAILESGGNNVTKLRFADTGMSTSLLTYKARVPANPVVLRGLRLMPPGHALARVTPTYFHANRAQAEVLLRTTPAAELASGILEVDTEAGADRILGGLEAIGLPAAADQVRGLISLTGWKRAVNPFPDASPLIPMTVPIVSPHADRIRLLWQQMRGPILDHFPAAGKKSTPAEWFERAKELYAYDAYHSLLIEGFQVTAELIARIAAGGEPDESSEREENNRLAAKGYSLAHASVMESIRRIFDGESAAEVVSRDLPYWYSELHRPFVQVGRMTAADLSGYRERPVFLRGSRHVPPHHGRAVVDGMEAFYAALREEPSAAVRAVLGHFVFVFIHPFPDGNGRIARFLMNAMLASGNCPWTILRVERRIQYMESLEEASANRNIQPFAKFVAQEMALKWSAEISEAERKFRNREV